MNIRQKWHFGLKFSFLWGKITIFDYVWWKNIFIEKWTIKKIKFEKNKFFPKWNMCQFSRNWFAHSLVYDTNLNFLCINKKFYCKKIKNVYKSSLPYPSFLHFNIFKISLFLICKCHRLCLPQLPHIWICRIGNNKRRCSRFSWFHQ